MKKLLLLISSLAFSQAMMAQISITGSNLTYSQDFNTLTTTTTPSNALPTGWQIWESGAGAAADQNYIGDNGGSNGGNTYSYGTTGNTERGLGSLASGNVTPRFGAKFINNTGTDITKVNITHRIEQWRLGNINAHNDSTQFFYSTNATGVNDSTATWVEVPTMMMNSVLTSGTTAGAIDGNTNFSTKVDSFTVTIPTGGTLVIRWVDKNILGSDDGLTVDDLSMTFSTSTPPPPNYRPNVVYVSPADNSVNVPLSTSTLKMAFDRSVSKGTGNLYLYNDTDGTNFPLDVNNAAVVVTNDTVSVSGVILALGKSYHVNFDSTAFDTAGYKSYGIYDATTWNFSTPPIPPTTINETFDAACATNNLPVGWTRENVVGTNQQWGCSGGVNPNKYVQMNGFAATVNNDNEDWLITPGIDLSASTNPTLFFRAQRRFNLINNVSVLYSTNYSGIGNPNTATWTNLNINFNSLDTAVWTNFSAPLMVGNPTYVAFKYNCTAAAADCGQWRIDSVVVTSTTSILSVKGNNQMPVSVLGASSATNINIGFVMDKAAIVATEIYDLNGRMIYRKEVQTIIGTNRVAMTPSFLPSGMYIVRVVNGNEYGVAKAIIQ